MKDEARKAELARLRLATPPIALYDEPRVFVPYIGYDQDLDAYYVSANEEGVHASEIKSLPANFHTHELMAVNPTDRAALLDFQRAWGLLTSHLREPLREDTIGTPGKTISTPVPGESDDETFTRAKQLYEQLKERHEDFRETALDLMTTVEPGRNGAYTFVPGSEAEATLTYLQSTIKELVKAHTMGFDNWGGINARILRGTVGTIVAATDPYYPRYRMLEPSIDGRDPVQPVLPLTIAALAQLLSYIASDEGYRECKQCHRYFLYKRHTVGEFVRNRRSLYCSDECKARASSSAQAARRKAARLAEEMKEDRP